LPLFYQHNINETTKLAIWKIEEEAYFFLEQVPLQREITHPHKRLQHLAGRYLLRFLFPDFPFEEILIADTHKPYLPEEQYHFSISHCGNYAAAIVSSTQRVGIDIEIPTPKVLRITHKYLHPDELEMFKIQDPRIKNQESSSKNQESSSKNQESSSKNQESSNKNQESSNKNQESSIKEQEASNKNQKSSIKEQEASNKKQETILPAPDSRLPTPDSGLPTPDYQLPTLLWSAKEAMFKWWGWGEVDFSEMLRIKHFELKEAGMIQSRFIRQSMNVPLELHYKIMPDICLVWLSTEAANI